MKLSKSLTCLIFAVAAANGQTWDASGNKLLNGTYFFRHVVWLSGSDGLNLGYSSSLTGNVSFDGNGSYTVTATLFDSATLSTQAYNAQGTYSISQSGYGFMSSPAAGYLGQVLGGTVSDNIYGLVAKGIFIGSSTENLKGYSDLFIAAPVGSTPPSISTLSGNYAFMDLDDPTENPLDARSTLISVSANGSGSFTSFNATARIGANGGGVNQSIPNLPYSVSNGVGSFNLRGIAGDSILVPDAYNLYISPAGDFVFGGAVNGWDMLFGVRTAQTVNSSFSGFYYQAGLDMDLTQISSAFAAPRSYYGSLYALASNGQKLVLEHQRRSSRMTGGRDYTLDHPYSFNSDGTMDDPVLGQHYVFSSDGSIRIGLGAATSLGISIAVQSPAFTGTGVSIDPRGVTNAGSTALFSSRIVPGELITIYGTPGATFAPQSVSDPTFPLMLGGLYVLINNRLAPVWSVDAAAKAVTVMVPYETTEPIASIQIVYNSVPSNTVTVFTGQTAPGVFTLPPGGISYAAARHVSDESIVGPNNPGQVGETISLYLTGLGTVSPPVGTGAPGPSNPLSWASHDIQVVVDGVPAPAPQFVGLTPTVVGLGVINMQIPPGVRTGQDVLVSVVGPDSSTTQALLSIKGGSGSAGMSAIAGDNQSAIIGTTFAARLVVLVKDSTGKPAAGTIVTFTPPGTGPGGTFAGGVNVAVTDSSGVATSPAFTANTFIGNYVVTASTADGATAGFKLTNAPRLPASIVAVAGTPQSAPTNTVFRQRFSASVKDSAGRPVSGTLVTFAIVGGSAASGTFSVSNRALTDSAGLAIANPFTANGISGSYTVTASVAGVPTSASFSLTNTASVSSITATSGTPQSTTVSTAFPAPLVVSVKDSVGNPVSGVTVTFTAPSTGASGTFAGGQNTATSNAAGVATSAVFTANGTAGSYVVLASVPGVGQSASFALTNTAAAGGSITATGGTPQSAAINTPFANRLSATVKDGSGNPVSGTLVTFTAPSTGASGTFAGGVNTATTNASGVATSAVFTANGTTGSYTVTASASGISAPASFALTNTGGTASSIATVSGTPQSAAVGTAFAAPFAVVVKDAGGNPLSGITVTFTAPASGASGTFANGANTAITNASGVATSAAFTANGTAGSYVVTASVAGVSTPASFSLTNTVGTPSSIVATSGTPQSAAVNTPFPAPLVATLKDSSGNPLPNVVVTFTAPSAGASGTFAGGVNTATTNASGVATSAVFTANGTAGSYSVAALAPGVATAANFSLTNTAGPPSSIAATSGTPQTAGVNTAFAARLVATVQDAGGNPVSGAVVTFTAPSSGPSGTFASGANTATTNASGVATSAVFTANGVAGNYTVTASVGGVATPATFSLTNSGSPSSITATGGTPQSAPVTTAFPARLMATVKDGAGNPVSGVTVTFAAPSSGPSGTFAGGVNTATTNASGVATSAVFTANSITGSYSVTAVVTGVLAPATFSLTNTSVSGGGISVSALSVGQNLEATISVTLPQPAPPGGVQVTLNSGDPSQLLLAGRPGDAGAGSIVVSVGEGQTTVTNVFVQSLASSGTVTVTASAPNFASGTANITLTPSAFVIAGPGGIATAFSVDQGSNTSLTVSAMRLDPAFNLAEKQQLRGGFSATVAVTSSATAVGTITVSPVTFNGGADVDVSTQFNALTPGTTTISVNEPSGFSNPAVGKTLAATVNSVGLSAPNVSVGNNLETAIQVTLIGTSPTGGLPITITSGNAAKVLFSTSPTAAGSASITVTAPAGVTRSPQFYVQGADSTGAITYTATAPGFGSSTGTVTLAPSGFVIQGPFGLGNPFSTNTGAGPATFTVIPVMIGSPLTAMPLAGGASASVTVNSSNSLVGSISPSPVAISGGADNATTTFQPLSNGSTNVSVVQPAGYSAPPQYTSVSVTVSTPGIALTDGVAIGFNLQTIGTVGLGAIAPAGGITVTLTSNSAQLRLSANGNTTGTASLTVTIPAGQTSGPSFFLQSLGSSGTATYTASAPGYTTRTATITLTPSGPVIAGPNGLGTSFFSASKSGGPVQIRVYMGQLDPNTGKFATQQPLIGGLSLTLNLSSSAPGIGTIASPVTFTGGPTSDQGVSTPFTPVSQGSTVISVAAPAGGYVLAGDNVSLTAQVGP